MRYGPAVTAKDLVDQRLALVGIAERRRGIECDRRIRLCNDLDRFEPEALWIEDAGKLGKPLFHLHQDTRCVVDLLRGNVLELQAAHHGEELVAQCSAELCGLFGRSFLRVQLVDQARVPGRRRP